MKLQLSKHLFWDVDPDSLDEERSKDLIITRVLQYGLIGDWKEVKDYYGLDKVAEVASADRDLDPKTASFISLLSGIPKDRFRCYQNREISLAHWL